MITFKKLVFSASQTQETNAYTADVYWHGRKIGTIRNDGNGGMSHLYPSGPEARADIQDATNHAKEQLVIVSVTPGEKYQYLEDYIDDLALLDSHKTRVERWLKRSVKNRVVVIVEGEVRTSIKANPSLSLAAIKDAMRRKYPAGTIVNDLAVDDAVARLTQCRGFTLSE